jgi:hypothetical protein
VCVAYRSEHGVRVCVAGVLDHYLKDCGRADLSAVFDWASPDSFPLMMDPPSPSLAGGGLNANGPLPNFTAADRAFANTKQLRCHHRFAVTRVCLPVFGATPYLCTNAPAILYGFLFFSSFFCLASATRA